MMHLMIALLSLIALSATLTLIGMMLLQNAEKIIAALQLDDAHWPMASAKFANLRQTHLVPDARRYRVASGALSAPVAL